MIFLILLDTIESCERFIEGMDFDEFVSDEKNTFVLRHPLKIIGEAVKHIPDEIRKEYISAPWRKISGTCDVMMIHAYFGVDLDVVWKTANERLPELKKDIEKILKEKNLY
ncbi:HepT-like ribonuclease domain-containing protein [Methanosarcina siciliae]|uniref:HepT-like ribonuclease domain-containing protein n=1 Tax=Methanosarcina siciliae TaxID=38027 RepID=UPI00064E4E88|nr:HepT-like ribonuclease domain-containing protein [Methanosarcina siciliae]